MTFVLQVRKNPEKTSHRKRVPTGDQTRARCVPGAHATACFTAVVSFNKNDFISYYVESYKVFTLLKIVRKVEVYAILITRAMDFEHHKVQYINFDIKRREQRYLQEDPRYRI